MNVFQKQLLVKNGKPLGIALIEGRRNPLPYLCDWCKQFEPPPQMPVSFEEFEADMKAAREQEEKL